nr:ruBisCO large subunit-binding protein subunit beta, chloroplastic [Ipomoea batatas]
MQAQKQSVKNAINAHAVNIPLYVVLDIGLDTEVDMNVFNEGRPVRVEGLDLEVQEIMDILVYYLQGGQVGDSEIVFEMQQISETVATVLGMQHAKLKSSFVLIGLITEKECFNAATTWFFVPKKACVHEVAVQFLVSLHTYAGKRAIADKLVRQVAAKTNGLAGDGTTTSVVLAQGLSDEGVKIVAAVALYLRKVGAEIVKRALSYPLKLIAKTAGVNESVVSEKVFSSDNSKYEYNASAAKVVGSGCMLTLKPMCWITFQVCIASWCSECIFLMLELKSEKEKAKISKNPSQKGFTAEEAYYLTFIVSWASKLACSSLRGGVGGRYEHASREE